jgi:hypothetical protein
MARREPAKIVERMVSGFENKQEICTALYSFPTLPASNLFKIAQSPPPAGNYDESKNP